MLEGDQTTSEEIKEYLAVRNFKMLRSIFKVLPDADIAEIFDDLSVINCIVLFRLVPKDRRTEVFSFIEIHQQEMIERLPDIVVGNLLETMEPVDRTKLLEDLPSEIRSKIIGGLSPGERDITKIMFSYPEDSIGRLMTPEFVGLQSQFTVKEALEYIRWNAARIPESLFHHLFITDHEGKYLGHVSLASLVIADPPTTIMSQIMDVTLKPLLVAGSKIDAVDYFRKYDSPYIPIVDHDDKLVGIVEADDIFDVAEEEASDDIHQFGGQGVLEDSYFQTPQIDLLKNRATWLGVLFLGMMATASALEAFDDTIKAMSYLVFFLPMIISSGGNAGSQAASLMIRGLAVKEVELKDWSRVLGRELSIGGGLGVILGMMGFLRVFVGDYSWSIALIVAVSLIGVVVFGSVAGSMLPFILKKVNLDPAVSSSPVIASLVDVIGILIFFNVAIYTMSLF